MMRRRIRQGGSQTETIHTTANHPWLTVAAGVGLAVVMVGAVGVHLSRGEGSHVPSNVVLLILAVLVVVGRIAIAPAVA